MKSRIVSFIVCAIVGMLLIVACSSTPPAVLPPVVIATSTPKNPFGTLIASSPTPLPPPSPTAVPTPAPPTGTGRIAFFSSDCKLGSGDVFVANADGSGVTKLIQQSLGGSGGLFGLGTLFSPNGSRLLWFERSKSDVGIYVTNIGSAQKNKLPLGPDDRDFIWSPDNQHLAFYRLCIDKSCDNGIYVINADGTGLVNLVKNTATDPYSLMAMAERPIAWSPDGTLLAFTKAVGPDSSHYVDEIYVMHPDGSSQTRLTNSSPTTNGQQPDMNNTYMSLIQTAAWSHDGTKIAFTRQGDPEGQGANGDPYGVYLLKGDGSAPTKLGAVKFVIRRMAWASDDSWLIIEDWSGGVGTFRVNLDGSGITPWLPSGIQAVWSLDGSRIAYTKVTKNTDSSNIFVMNADGTGETKVVSDELCNISPAWIP